MIAQDGGSPRLTATATVSITVLRNIFPPVFSPVTYNQTILETQSLGVTILSVNATDNDQRVRMLLNTGNPFFFAVLPKELKFKVFLFYLF